MDVALDLATGATTRPTERLGAAVGGTRRGVLAGAGALAAGMLGACAPGASPGAGTPPGATGQVVELRTHARAGSERDGYQKNVDAFNAHYEGKYHATYEPVAGNLYEGQETQIAGGTIGDIHYAHQSNLKYQEYAVRGAARALDDLIGRDKAFRLGAWPERGQEALRVIEGKVYGLPIRGQVAWVFLYRNRDLLRSAGQSEPTPSTIGQLAGEIQAVLDLPRL
jgi:ABC-type glycerol-3-phosphate transport system substrate-binding protein